MTNLIQPRGKGYVFRMKTPEELVGTPNPRTGKPFGQEIKLGLGTRRKAEAREQRDLLLGEIRQLVLRRRGVDAFSLEQASAWREEIVRAGEGLVRGVDAHDVRLIVRDQMAAEKALPKGRRKVTNADLKEFERVALGSGLLLKDALPQYLQERGEEAHKSGYQPLKASTVRDVQTAVRYLLDHKGPGLSLTEVGPNAGRAYLQEELPSRPSARSPKGLSYKTVRKHATLLAGLWDWAVDRGHLPKDHPNPWRLERLVRMAKVEGLLREDFTADEVRSLLAAAPAGDRMGDAMRLSLLTGCRADELGQVRWTDFADDLSAFTVRDGKSTNARRLVPLSLAARELVEARRRAHPSGGDGRLLWDWPLRPSNGKCSSLSQGFTHFRRKVLGKGSDGALAFHSFRHTWRTQALRAGLTDYHTHQIGGWALPRSSSSPYNHGYTRAQLVEAQEKVAAYLRQEGFLDML